MAAGRVGQGVRMDVTHSDGEPAACQGKHGYVSPALAHQAAGRAKMKKGIQVYRCKLCGLWHIGAVLKARRRGK